MVRPARPIRCICPIVADSATVTPRASTFASTLSSLGLVGAIGLPSRAAMRLRPTAALKVHLASHDQHGAMSRTTLLVTSAPALLLPQLSDEADEPFGRDPHLERVPLNTSPLARRSEEFRDVDGAVTYNRKYWWCNSLSINGC